MLLAWVVAHVFIRGASLAGVASPLALMLALVICRAGLLWISEVLAQRASGTVRSGVREQILSRLVELGPAFTRGQRGGELIYAAGEATEAFDAYVTRYLPARAQAVIVPVMAAGVVLALDPWSVLVLVVTWPILLILLALIGGNVRDLSRRRERELAWLSAHFLDLLRGLPTLKMFGRSAEQAVGLEAVSRRYASATMDVLRTALQTTLVLEWGATAATALVAIEASVRLMGGGLTFDRALAVLLVTPELFLPLRRLAAEYHAKTAAQAAVTRIEGALSPAPGSPRSLLRGVGESGEHPAKRGEGGPRQPWRRISFHDVHVTYDQGTRTALRGFSLEIRAGQTVALVGPSGAGKTTVANLLLRFVQPRAGSVTVDGVNLADTDPTIWRRQVAWVPERPWLFAGTAADNIRLARPDATDHEVLEAARRACADGFVSALPEGFSTRIGEDGAMLSGGERQRLAIARAFLKDAPLLILDEPTAHLDEGSQAEVLAALTHLSRGRTVLLIAHRPELVRTAQVVVRMEAGRVAGLEPSPMGPARWPVKAGGGIS